MAKYKTYSEYKDSGVEWLGEIPTHWVVCRLKNLATIKNGQDYKSVQVEDGYPVIGSGGQFTFASKFMYDKPSVLLGRKGTIDKPLYINKPFWTVDTMYYTELNKGVDAKYLYYLALTIQFSRYSTNTALPSMTQEHLSNYKFSIPRVESERRGIIDFLHHETAKIDILIEKQQQLIELLKEKRQAVISHAVTKGLNPDVPMKDSGVEWLGTIPKHWSIWKLFHAYDTIGSGTTPTSNDENWFQGNIPWVTTGELRENIINNTLKNISTVTLQSFSALKLYPAGSIIIAMYGATIGRIGILGVDATTNQACCAMTKSKVINNLYLKYWLQTFRENIINLSSGGGQPNINQEKVASLKISSPDLNEQLIIIDFLDKKTTKIDDLISKQLQQIELLKERRTALISAAVTGKIDVRHWRAPNEQTTAEAEVSV